MPILRLYTQDLWERKIKDHPQVYMKKLGYAPTKAQPESIADCWFFEVDKIIQPKPAFLAEVQGYEFE
jgi:hypothetical protein